jgi:urease accessory protein
MSALEPAVHRAASSPWQAELSLGFTRTGAASVMTKREHRGPLRVQRALYPEGESVCQAIVLHPPSGIVGGDELRLAVEVGAGAHAQLTTPGAGKWYRSAGPEASQELSFSVGENACLEWLPQETIVFDGARCRMRTQVALAAGARYVGCEVLCLGRSAAGERFTRGTIALATRIERAGAPLWIERGRVDGGGALLASPVGWVGASVCATLVATLLPGDEVAALLEQTRAIAAVDGGETAITALPALFVARYLGHHSEAARQWLTAIWQTLRPALIGRPALVPRIWNT